MFGLYGLNAREISQGMIDGRTLAVEYTDFYRKYVPGCEQVQLLTTAPLLGVRDTRRIIGEFELTIEDYTATAPVPGPGRGLQPASERASHRQFEGRARAPHGASWKAARSSCGRGQCVGIPYGILVPREWENLWVAGRCHSSDTMVHGSIRAQSAAFMMGEASFQRGGKGRCSGQVPVNTGLRFSMKALRPSI